tara:strand:+ start:187 stop:429 length:243 start_codon:yes stop_codon:yes gene_type:complete
MDREKKSGQEERETRDLIWASGHYLTEHFPPEFADWEEDKVDKFIDEHRWEPFEYHQTEDVWELIEHLAWSVRRYIKETS